MSNLHLLSANRATIERMKSKGPEYLKTVIQEVSDSAHSPESKEAFLKLLFKAQKELTVK